MPASSPRSRPAHRPLVRLPRPLIHGRGQLTPRQVWRLFADRLELSPGGCWLWTGARNSDGYPAFRDDDGRVVLVGRWVLAHAVRRFRKGELACHGCDTPPCIRPDDDHLRHGTNASNMREMWARKRRSRPVTFLEAS